MRRFEVEDLGNNLRRIRLDRVISQETLAEEAGVSPRYVSLIEAGQRNPTLAVLLSLARALRVPPAQLFRD